MKFGGTAVATFCQSLEFPAPESYAEPKRVPKPQVEPELVSSFINYWRGEDTREQIQERREIAREQVAHLSERLFAKGATFEHLQAIGAIYRPVKGESPLNGFPVRLPQDHLVEAHAQSFFYSTVLTHPSRLNAYIRTEQAGLKTAHGNRLRPDHKLFDSETAYTFGDFGFEPSAPDPNDGVDEKTSENIAAGADLSWTNHQFPSSFLMGSSMPSNWGDLALARGAETGCVMFCPLDGDVHRKELQRARFLSARELLERSPNIKYHPFKDVVLCNGQKVAEYLPEFGRRHLGLAIKPSKDIVKQYKSIIEGEQVPCVEIYDPGFTNLAEYSANALRDAFPDLPIYLGRLGGPVNIIDLITRLNKLRVTFRLGIAEGKICSTSETGGGLAPKNCQAAAIIANMAEELAAETGVRVIVSVEAGATSRLTVLGALGTAGYSTTNLVGGTLEHLPPHYAWIKDGMLYKPYDGEACPGTKKKAGLIDRMGNPLNPEGVNGIVGVNNYYTSLPYRTFALLVGLVKGLRFIREDNMISMLSGGRDFSDYIPMFSDKASGAAAVHAPGATNGK